MPGPTAVRHGNKIPAVVFREYDDFGITSLELVYPPRRFWGDDDPPHPVFETGVDARRVDRPPTPADLLGGLPEADNWAAQGRKSLARLAAWYLVCEDPLRRLEARRVTALAHQVSVVRHVLENDHLRRVLIADEVGLGKTVEAGLIVKELLDASPGLRVLYLAPARLVVNVRYEFDRLGLAFRQWTAVGADARLTDSQVVASIHRAVHGPNHDALLKAAPWDVLVIDECHHLTDWAAGGGNPKEKYRLARELIDAQPPGGRVLLLSGTPHQGHEHRFNNLLKLLLHKDEVADRVTGRVIYRTKDDVRDWDGRRLFPGRRVNEPVVVDLGPEYRDWIGAIHKYFRASQTSRAAGWRCAQALQWAASSPQAGLGYLVRQAARAGYEPTNPAFAAALAALRPYRLGQADEPIEDLFRRILKEASPPADLPPEDIEDTDELTPPGAGPDTELEDLLTAGVRLLLGPAADEKWATLWGRVLDGAGADKIVLFAQPIETVMALAGFLERRTGRRPALIVGGQSDDDRNRQVRAFWSMTGPQFLVSSRAGGEGINLQVAHRLVHVDVPWNPMELEQRVGRVHRFGSRKTIVVDTLVVKDSREADAYKVARQKLKLITRTMVPAEQFEAVFSRVMGLVSPEELQGVLIDAALGPLTDDDAGAVAKIVQDGFNRWRDFDRMLKDRQESVRAQDPGLAGWADLARFATDHLAARPREDFSARSFDFGDESPPPDRPAPVLEIGGEFYQCGDYEAGTAAGPNGEPVRGLGLNTPAVAQALRDQAFQPGVGAAHLRWPKDGVLPGPAAAGGFGVLAFVRQSVRTDPRNVYVEQGQQLVVYWLTAGGEPGQLDGPAKRDFVRAVLSTSPARLPPDDGELAADLRRAETALAQALRVPSDRDRQSCVRHAVFPLFAAVVTV